MAIVLHDLVANDDRRFSPHCWRIRMALAHKGLEVEARPTTFSAIPDLCPERFEKVPIIEDGAQRLADSWAIARYLEQQYPERPSLFGQDGVGLTVFIQSWVNRVVQVGVINLIIQDIHDHLLPEDQDYFRRSREARFGKPLQEIQAGRETRVEAFRHSLDPLRQTLQRQPFIAGEGPRYADYIAFSAFQWGRVVSDFPLLLADDPIFAWVERCLDLHDAIGRSTPAYG